MTFYNVAVHFEGQANFNVAADSEEEAKKLALDLYRSLSPQEIKDNVESFNVDEVLEVD